MALTISPGRWGKTTPNNIAKIDVRIVTSRAKKYQGKTKGQQLKGKIVS